MTKKHRVRARPKVRRQRTSLLRSLAVLLVVLACGAAVVRAKPWSRLRVPGLGPAGLPALARVDSIELPGAPPALEAGLRRVLAFEPGARWGLREPARASARLSESFPCLLSVDWHRSYLSRSVRFETRLRAPLAVVVSESGPSGFLDETGRVFAAPEGVYDPAGLPRVELAAAPPGGFADLGKFLLAAGAPGALPAKLARLRYSSEDGGWVAALEDGMELVWGKLEWTRLKLDRLSEVLADAGPRFGAALTADLRYFEDGKILVRPR